MLWQRLWSVALLLSLAASATSVIAESCTCPGGCSSGCQNDGCCGCGTNSSECVCCAVDETCSAHGGPGVKDGTAGCNRIGG